MLAMNIGNLMMGVVLFAAILFALAGILLYLKSVLIPAGNVKIIVNGDTENPIEVAPGTSLLTALSTKNIFLPSACGGGGTCAMCTCQVSEGGGDILPTELNHISRKDAKDNWRLSCQVKVKNDMEVHVPEEIFGIKKWECEVVSNYNVSSFIKEFVVKLPEGDSLDFEAGGYIQIDVPETVVDYKDIDIAAHPDHHGDDLMKFQEEWDKFCLLYTSDAADES